jgi:pimeloyl-ACP methyl ester carboxylesterase
LLVVDIKPFSIAVDPAVLDDLRDRIDRTRWPDEPPVKGWTYGADAGFLRELLDSWRAFDWAAYARRLNGMPQFRATVDGLDVHFVHVRGTGPSPLPIIVTHGWPGSFLEYLDLIPLLAAPDDPADAFDVVVPSVPGFGFSPAPTRPNVTSAAVAQAWHQLMTEGLGYQRFAAQGSDIGAGITSRLGLRDPERVVGVHLSALALPKPPQPWSDAERGYFAAVELWLAEHGGYSHQQGTRPQTLGQGLADSPAGLAAWIVEKYRDWSASEGDVDSSIGRERLLATLTLYWVTNTITSSMRMYYENSHHLAPLTDNRDVAAGFAVFPNEFRPVPNPPRELAERYYRVERWREFSQGGHFPAIEQPHILAEEIRAFFRPLR